MEKERERGVRGGGGGGGLRRVVKMSAPSTSRLSAITVTSYRGEIWLLYRLVYLLLVFWHKKNKQLFILIQAQTHNSTPEHDFPSFVFSFYIRNF